MPLPFNFSGRVVVPEQSDVSLAASRIERALEDLKGKRVRRVGSQIHFTAGIFRAVSGYNLLVPVGSGELALEPSGTGIAVIYRLQFTQIFLLVSVAVLGFLGPPVVSAPN